MTLLTVYYTNTAGTTLSTTNQLSITHGTDNVNVTQLYSLVGTATGWGSVYAQGNTGAWAAAGSIGSPAGHGFMLETSVLNLSGNTIAAGSWSANVRLACGHTDGTLTGSLTGCAIHVRVYKYNGGTYTSIIDMSLTGQTINSTITTYALSGSTGSGTAFSSGDLLYTDIWVDVGTNTNSDAALNIRLNRESTNNTGDSNAEVVTPGYSATGTQVNKDIVSRFLLSIQKLRDISGRVLIASQKQRDLSTRFLLSSQRQRDLSGRVLISSQKLRDLLIRGLIAAQIQKNISARFLLSTVISKDGQLRGRIAASTKRDVICRLSVAALGGITFPSLFPGSYTGFNAAVPVILPYGFSYVVNGTTVPDIPIIATAPLLQGGQLLSTTSFTLLFSSASSTTQSLFTTGSTITLTFVASDGSAQTGSVLVQSVLSGNMFLVFCTLQAPIQLNRWVVVTQFF